MNRRFLCVALLSASLVTTSAFAAEELLPGAKLKLSASSKGAKATVVWTRDPLAASLDPVVDGASLTLVADGTGQVRVLDLPSSGWSSKKEGVFAYAADVTDGQPSQAKLVRKKVTKLVLKGLGDFALTSPLDSVGAVLEVGGSRLCALFGGKIAKDEDSTFVAAKAPAPAGCLALPDGACIEASDCPVSDICATADCVDNACVSGVVGSGAACRDVADECDLAETCDGVAPACPVDLDCGCGPVEPVADFSHVATDQAITDITTGVTVADPALLANLQTAILMPDEPGTVCEVEIDLLYGCFAVEFLFSEMNGCVDSSSLRVFEVSASELGLSGAAVNAFQQLGGAYLFYPGAYTASGPVLDGTLDIQFETVTRSPILSGFVVTPLIGCSIPPPPEGTPAIMPGAPVVSLDLGVGALPDGVRVTCVPPMP